jgi:hypothetical protein
MSQRPTLKPHEHFGESLRAMAAWLLVVLVAIPGLVIHAADRLTSCIIRKRGGRD